jgi:hypothetical protein
MERPLSSWKYESGFVTVFHGGTEHELGYFKRHDEARNAALAFFRRARRSTMKGPRRVVDHFRRSKTSRLLQKGLPVSPN